MPQRRRLIDIFPAEQLRRLNRWFWRWHFWPGFFLSPIILLVTVSGGLLVWVEEIDDHLLKDLRLINPGGERITYDEMISKAAEKTEGAFFSLRWSGQPNESALVYFSREDGETEQAWVNVHTGEVLGTRLRSELFSTQLTYFHRWLLSGRITGNVLPGRILVELATSWTILLTLSGILLWWNGSRAKPGQWRLFQKQKPYIVWRNWHSVPAVWLSVFLIILLITGLAFSKGAGTLWAGIGNTTGAFPDAYTTPPTFDNNKEVLPYETLINISETSNDEPELNLIAPEGSSRMPMIIRGDYYRQPWTNSITWIDPVSGEIKERAEVREMPLYAQAYFSAYALHVGSFAGIWSKLLATLLCLLIVFLVISGIAMWWLRRPKGKSGIPKRRTEAIPLSLLLVNGLLAIIFPIIGATLLALFLYDVTIKGYRKLRQIQAMQ